MGCDLIVIGLVILETGTQVVGEIAPMTIITTDKNSRTEMGVGGFLGVMEYRNHSGPTNINGP